MIDFLREKRRNIKRNVCKKICSRRDIKEIVIVFPHQKNENKILLIKEYIHCEDKSFWKFVSGGVDKENKSILDHAKEELYEEVGMEVLDNKLKEYYSFEESFFSKKIHCFIAEDPTLAKKQVVNPDESLGNYILEKKWVNKDELQTMINKREIIWNETVLVALQILLEKEAQVEK